MCTVFGWPNPWDFNQTKQKQFFLKHDYDANISVKKPYYHSQNIKLISYHMYSIHLHLKKIWNFKMFGVGIQITNQIHANVTNITDTALMSIITVNLQNVGTISYH